MPTIALNNTTVVTMTLNKYMKPLLINFVCASRAHGVSMKHILVFATDPETRDLARGLGLTAYYNKEVLYHTYAQNEYDSLHGDQLNIMQRL